MADSLTCQHDRTPDACEDCAYLYAVEVGILAPPGDGPDRALASRGDDRAPILPTAASSTHRSRWPSRGRGSPDELGRQRRPVLAFLSMSSPDRERRTERGRPLPGPIDLFCALTTSPASRGSIPCLAGLCYVR